MINLQSFGPEESQKYHESEYQKKILYIPNLSFFLNNINLQMLKLPHEVNDPNARDGGGTTYADIERSIINGIEAVWAQLSPLRRKLGKGDTLLEYDGGRPRDFDQAMRKLEVIYLLLDAADSLNDNMVSDDLDLEDEFDDDFEPEQHDKGDMPAPVNAANGEAVGGLEKENPQPMVPSDVAKGV